MVVFREGALFGALLPLIKRCLELDLLEYGNPVLPPLRAAERASGTFDCQDFGSVKEEAEKNMAFSILLF